MESTLYGKTKHYQKRIFSMFFSYLPKRYDACRKHFMEKLYNITKNVYFECFLRFLRSEILKCMQSTRYGETKRYYEIRVL